jgi:hypothetical protein
MAPTTKHIPVVISPRKPGETPECSSSPNLLMPISITFDEPSMVLKEMTCHPASDTSIDSKFERHGFGSDDDCIERFLQSPNYFSAQSKAKRQLEKQQPKYEDDEDEIGTLSDNGIESSDLPPPHAPNRFRTSVTAAARTEVSEEVMEKLADKRRRNRLASTRSYYNRKARVARLEEAFRAKRARVASLEAKQRTLDTEANMLKELVWRRLQMMQ